MRKIIILLSLSFISFIILSCTKEKAQTTLSIQNSRQVSNNYYLTIDEYNILYPMHAEKMKNFSDVVEAPGKTIKENTQDDPVKIVFLYPGDQISDYWQRSIKSFEGRMDEVGIQYEITEIFTRAGSQDIREQESATNELLTSDYDYLVFTLNVQSHQKIIEQIIIEGSPKIILQNITTPISIWEGKQPFLYVGFDHMKGTELIADYYINKAETDWKYTVLFHSEGYVSEMRGDFFIDYTETKSEINILSAFYTDGRIERAKAAVLDVLNNERPPDFIYSCATDITIGALEAFAEMGLSKEEAPAINGWGGGSKELELLLKNEIDVTVMRMNDDNGVAMAEAIKMDLEGRWEQMPQIYSGEMVLIESGISVNELEKLKDYAFRYSNGEK